MPEAQGVASSGQPFVSVILPVLNGEGRLEFALEALQRQDYPAERFEVIVADGGSTDATERIAREHGATVVPNLGVSVAAGRNAGLAVARGEFLAFSEDDIVLPPHWLSEATREITSSGADGIGGPTPLPAGASDWSVAVNALFRIASDLGASVQSDRLKAGEASDLPGGNVIYRATSLRQVLPIDEDLITAEDVSMHRRMRERGMRLMVSPALSAEHRKRDTVRGFYRQMFRFAVGRVQLSRKEPGALGPIHHAVAWLTALSAWALGSLWFRSTGLVLGLCALSALVIVLLGVRRGERPRAAALLPLAALCFSAGWSIGYFSELLVPTRRAQKKRANEAPSCLAHPLDAPAWAACLIGAIVLLKIGVLFALAIHSPFAMDEFQQGGYARFIDVGYYSAVIPFKTVLFTYLYLVPRLFFRDAVSILIAQRLETAGLVLVTLGIVYKIARQVGRNRFEALLTVVVLLGFSTFLEQSFRLRAEPTALVLASLALLVALSEKRPAWRDFVVGLLLGAAFFSTQKSVWFVVSIGSALVWTAYRYLGLKSALGTGIRLGSALGCTVLAYAFAFPPASPRAVVAGVFFRSSHFAAASNYVYPEIQAFFDQTWQRDIPFCLAAGLGFALMLPIPKRSRAEEIVWIASLGVWSFIGSWKEPWPYVIAWGLPLAAHWAPDCVRVLARLVLWPEDARRRTWALAAAALLAFGMSLPRNWDTLHWSNRTDLALVAHVESLLGPTDRYQDGVGMISTRDMSDPAWWDAGALQRIAMNARTGDVSELEKAFAGQPKVLVMNYRLVQILPELAPFIISSYVPVEAGLMVAGVSLDGGAEAVFQNRWVGAYALVDARGLAAGNAFQVDGHASSSSVQLERGRHTIRAKSCQHCTLLPADLVSKVRPRSTVTQANLFWNVYTR